MPGSEDSRLGGDRSRLTAFSATGEKAASTRVRLLEWLARIDDSWEWSNYLGLAYYSVEDMLRHPARALDAERRLGARSLKGYENALIHREVSPASAGLQELIVRRKAARVAFDLDDAIYVAGASRLTALRVGKYPRIAASADVTIVGNAYLAEWAAQYCRDVRLIPTCIAPEDYSSDGAAVNNRHNLIDAVVWIGSPSTEAYLLTVASPLALVLGRHSLELHVISSGNPSLGALEPFARRIEWTPQASATLGYYRFGVAPLPVTEFTRGKSAYKLLQYGAAGLPFIASPVGANKAVGEAIGGLLATTSYDWISGMEYLLGMSESERDRLSAEIRTRTVARYSYDAWLPQWRSAVGLDSR